VTGQPTVAAPRPTLDELDPKRLSPVLVNKRPDGQIDYNESLPSEAQQYLAKASNYHADAVRENKGTAYSRINSPLRQGKELKGDADLKHRLLQNLFDWTPPFAQPVEVDRGIKCTPAQRQQLAAVLEQAHATGQLYMQPGYLSCSTAGTVAKQQTQRVPNVIFRIKATRGLDLKPLSAFAGEDEFLLNHNSIFRVERFSKGGRGQPDLYVLEQVQ
jgi:hypothetical protein